MPEFVPNPKMPTPERKTHIWFDLNQGYVSEPAYTFARPAQAMFKGTDSQNNGLEYTSGWGIKAYHEDIGLLIERTEAESNWALPSNGLLVVASGYSEQKMFRAPQTSEMPGVTTGASANLSTTGFSVLRKSVSAGTNFSTVNLSADQTAFPGPLYTEENPYNIDYTLLLDRVAVTTFNDSEELPIYFGIGIYGGKFSVYGPAARLYFNGPAGENDDGVGTGQYCLSLEGSGKAVLFEKRTTGSVWLKRYVMQAFESTLLHGSTFLRVAIYKSKTCATPDAGANGYIKFAFNAVAQDYNNNVGSNVVTTILNIALIEATPKTPKRHHYRVPLRANDNLGTTRSPLRLDIRRDAHGIFNVARFKYPTTQITAQDSAFELPFTPSDDAAFPFTLQFKACIPSGASVDCKLFRADTNVELTLLSGGGTNTKVYSLPAGVRRYYVKPILQATAVQTPILFEYRVSRDTLLRNPGIPSWEIGDASHKKSVIRSVYIKGAERDLAQESANIELADPLKTLTELEKRAGMNVKIETEYTAADTAKRVVLFRGFMDRAEKTRKPPSSKTPAYPVEGWGTYNLKCKGIWQQLQENFIDTPFPHLTDINGNPYKVTDLVKAFISRAGFDEATDFDFPSIPTTVFASDLDYSQKLDMLDKTDQVVKSMVRDYLSHFLIFDNNVGVNGKWRLIAPPVSPYSNLVEFMLDGPGAMKLVHHLPSYSGRTYTYDPGGPGELLNQPIESAPISGGTFRSWVKPPEANDIVVASIGLFESVPKIYTARKVNLKSFNATDTITADENHPDYLGRRLPMYVIDPALGAANSQILLTAAVNALCRRIYDLVAHALKLVSFEAPLVFVTHESDATKKRPLRYYDPVLVDGVQFLIRNVNPSYKKDGIQYAMYELEAPRI